MRTRSYGSRHLRLKLATAFSTGIFFACIGLWVRSYFRNDFVKYVGHTGGYSYLARNGGIYLGHDWVKDRDYATINASGATGFQFYSVNGALMINGPRDRTWRFGGFDGNASQRTIRGGP